jgi:hypothetical protein
VNAKLPPLPLVVAGAVPRTAQAALRRAGARLHHADGTDQALGAALAHDALLVVVAPAFAADGTLAALLDATGRGGDLLVVGARGQPGARCAWRGLARRFRRRARERRRAEAVFAARPGWAAMVQAYRAHLGERMIDLARACCAGDASAALRVVHDVKGTAGGYGFGQLTAASTQAQDHFLLGDTAAGFAASERLMRQAEEALR